MKKLFLIVCLTGCASLDPCEEKLRVSIGANVYRDAEWTGGPNATFEYLKECEEGYFYGLRHVSHWFSGGPFNNKPEVWYNEAVFGKEFDL